jgi:exodeoxyribonuclease V gamma subunit
METGMVQYRYAKIKAQDVIRAWISHLVFNKINNQEKPGSEMNTFLAGKDKIYKYIPVSENSSHLVQLLNLYWQGLSEPLHFFPRTSYVFAQEIYKGRSEEEALLKAKKEWEGDAYYTIAEKNDPYNSLCFKDMELADTSFMEQAKKIFLPVLEHQTRYTV